MPVYSLPAADVEAAAVKAIASDGTVKEARTALGRWHASPDGKDVDAAVSAGRMTEDDALYCTLLGDFTRDYDQAAAKVRQRIEMAFTVITPREVTAALRRMWTCYLSSRDAGDNLIEVTLPVHAAGLLYSTGGDFDRAEALLRSLLKTTVRVTGFHGATREGINCVTFTLKFPVAP